MSPGPVQLSLAATTQALIRYDQLESDTAPEQFTERLTSSSPWTGASHSEKAAKHSDDRIGPGKSETRTKALTRSLATGERFFIKKTRRPFLHTRRCLSGKAAKMCFNRQNERNSKTTSCLLKAWK